MTKPYDHRAFDNGTSEVGDWFKTRSILITGATGFLGKVLVERIASVAPVNKMYLLLRPKKGRNVKERLDDVLNSPLFDGLRDTYPERLANICAVKGDVLQEGLGLSDQDLQELIKECNVVFHCAANVRFDQKLKGAVITNTLGTKRVLQLAKQMTNLDAFVHVSTAYCHCDRKVLEEVSYPAPHDPDKIIDMVSWMDQDMLTTITPSLLGELPNTYAYSKALSEQLVTEHAKFFPVALSRPSIVMASWKDPFPGWIENLNGPTGLLVGAGKGVIRSMHCRANYYADIIPVDICVNALIALAWKTGTTKSTEPYICNLTESGNNPVTWGEVLDIGRKHLYNNPFTLTLWYPDGSIKASWILHILSVIFFHFIPAYFIDALLVLLRKKPFMVKTQNRISGGLDVLQYYTTKEWEFKNENLLKISDWLSPYDRKVLYVNNSSLNWDDYMHNYILGAREYCCKEDPATLPRARKILKRLYYLDRITTCLCYIFVLWMLWKYSSVFVSIANAISNIVSSNYSAFNIPEITEKL
ncbi:putative fatty acyl-CoA reductase CG5065 [Arctopsyche grandis]|uniref:putative fatty acyl-CoA reductase CG5065 n=1 Tax=Arctopsyche grandis TaxID=121162 RepID=UPI00406D6A0D